MGNYNDYMMRTEASAEPLAGVCHARGSNKDIPPQWLMYVNVEDLDKSIENVKKFSGKTLGDKKSMSTYGIFCLIQDPAGAFMMLCGD